MTNESNETYVKHLFLMKKTAHRLGARSYFMLFHWQHYKIDCILSRSKDEERVAIKCFNGNAKTLRAYN